MLIRGKATWCKVIGQPHDNKFSKTKQWSFDLSPDSESLQKLLEAGMKKSYIRDKGDSRGKFISFSREATRKDGTPGKPFEIVDQHNDPWPSDKLIGNGSVLNVIVSLNEREFRGEKFLKPSAIKMQVWDYVPYGNNGVNGSGFPSAPKATLNNGTDNSDTETSDKEW